MRVLFTGGSGKAGRHVVAYLLDQGHTVLNVDLTPLDHPGVTTIVADLMDPGAMWSLLTNYADLGEIDTGSGPQPFDAVVHFAAIPRIGLVPDHDCFRINTVTTYNVMEAATKLGIRKIVFASSETTYGVCFAHGLRQPPAIPLTEDLDTDPADSYAMSKLCNEATGRAFATRAGADVYGLRIGNVIEPHEYERDFPCYFENPGLRLRNAFCYVDARDLGQIVDLCLKKDGLGFQIFNAGNDGNSVALDTSRIIEWYYQGVPQTRDLGEDEAIYSNAKIRDVLGFREQHPWQRYIADPRGQCATPPRG